MLRVEKLYPKVEVLDRENWYSDAVFAGQNAHQARKCSVLAEKSSALGIWRVAPHPTRLTVARIGYRVMQAWQATNVPISHVHAPKTL